jgi:hypothetical protein
MAHPTFKTRNLEISERAPRVSENSDARREALDWLAGQLRWTRTLDALRTRSARR